MKALGLVGLLVLLQSLVGCAVNPATGRSDFVMMSEQQELAMGRQYNQEIAKQYPRYPDEALQAYVQQVGERVARYSHRSNLAYRFTVVDSPDINAFALPGGYIYIHRGLMAYLNSEAELAAVLGHEVGHVTARHSVRQQSQSAAWGILGQAVAIGTGVGAAADITNVLGGAVVSGYGRDMELEADGLGAQYLARSGYDPRAMIEVVKVLKAQSDFARDQARAKGQAEPPSSYHGLFDTHPDHDTRLQQVVGPASALAAGTGQEARRDEYLQRIQGLPFGDSADTGVRRGSAFYHRDLNFTLRYPQGWALDNRPDVLIGQSPDEQALMAMTLGDAREGESAAEFLQRKAGGQVREQLPLSGQDAVVGILPGRPARRVAVVMHGRHAYQFIGVVREGSLQAWDDAFMQVIKSFRPLRADERKLAEPRRLKLVKVQTGQQLRDFIGKSSKPDEALARLRLLNGLYPDGEAKNGEWLKILD